MKLSAIRHVWWASVALSFDSQVKRTLIVHVSSFHNNCSRWLCSVVYEPRYL